MKRTPRIRWVAGLVAALGIVATSSIRIAPLAAMTLLPACDAYDCSQNNCSTYGAADKPFMSCCACGGDYGASIELRDPSGNKFYHCDDNDGTTCAKDPGYLSAIESYCGI